MTFQSTPSFERISVPIRHAAPRPEAPAGLLSRRELRRIIAEQID